MQRTLAALLLVLLFGLSISTAVLGAELAPGVLFQDGFENGDTEIPPEWTVFSPGTLRRTTEVAYSGKYSFEIHDVDKAKGMGIRSPLFPIEVGKDYQVSAWAMVEGDGAQLYLEYWDATMTNRLEAPWVGINVTGQGGWQLVLNRATAPANAKYISVILYVGKVPVSRCYFDDVKLVDVAAN